MSQTIKKKHADPRFLRVAILALDHLPAPLTPPVWMTRNPLVEQIEEARLKHPDLYADYQAAQEELIHAQSELLCGKRVVRLADVWARQDAEREAARKEAT